MTDTHTSDTDAIPSYAVLCTIGGTSPGEILTIGDIDIQREVIDVTPHSSTSNVRKKIGGLINLGTFQVTLQYSKTAAAGFYGDMAGLFGGSKDVVVTFPFTASETLTFSAIVSGLKITAGDNDAVKMVCTLTLDGKTAPTWV